MFKNVNDMYKSYFSNATSRNFTKRDSTLEEHL